MNEYQTETGFYVLVDTNGTVIGKADVPAVTHPVADDADVAASFDVDTADTLADYIVGEPVE